MRLLSSDPVYKRHYLAQANTEQVSNLLYILYKKMEPKNPFSQPTGHKFSTFSCSVKKRKKESISQFSNSIKENSKYLIIFLILKLLQTWNFSSQADRALKILY